MSSAGPGLSPPRSWEWPLVASFWFSSGFLFSRSDGSRNSTDHAFLLLSAAPDPRVRALATPVRRGPGQARRAGCAAAQGRLISSLDHDDW
ncbi:glycosyltransferase [Frankia sp. AgB32]|uniref:glycosyltransferase n=1 Tax=Frankia sp. AgB32 TaxID=631119 RepID=UPI0034D725D5